MSADLKLVEVEPDHDMMVKHLRHLFASLVGTKWGDGKIEIAWTTVRDGKHRLNKAKLFPVTEQGIQSATTEALLQNGRGSNVYTGIAVRKPGTAPFARASDADVYCYTSLVIDLDEPGKAENAKNIWVEMAPTFCAMTGRQPHARMQSWWRLFEPSDDFALFTKLQTALAAAFGGDSTVTNPSRVMRLAGSIAHPAKPGRVKELAYIHPLKTPGTDISVDDVIERFGQAVPARSSAVVCPVCRFTGCPPHSCARQLGLFDGGTASPTASPTTALSNIGKITDGRDAYMRDTVLACLKQFIGENGTAPTHSQLFEMAWPQYERNTAVDVEGKQSRGAEEMIAKVGHALRRFESGQIASMRTLEEARESYRADTATVIKPDQQQLLTATAVIKRKNLVIAPFELNEDEAITPRDFNYGRHYIRKFASATVAYGGVGKSSLIIVEALAMATGRPLLGITVPKRRRVWLWNGEDPMEEMQRRIVAACRAHNIKSAHIEGYLFVSSGRDMPIRIATSGRNGAQVDTPLVDNLIEQFQSWQIDVACIDPFISSHGVPENDNNGIDDVVKQWARIADIANCSVELVHHLRKTGGNEATVEDARGASALLAAVRSARVLNTMSEDEARRLGIEDNRKLHFKVDNGKANMARSPDKADWYQLTNVNLGNRTDPQFDNSDDVGVVRKWSPPDLLAGITPHHTEKIFVAIRGGEWRADPRSDGWVGNAVAQVLGLSSKKDRDKAVVNKWLSDAYRGGSLVKVTRKDENRNPRQFAVAADS